MTLEELEKGSLVKKAWEALFRLATCWTSQDSHILGLGILFQFVPHSSLFVCLFVCLFDFLRPHPGHMEVPRLGVESEL